MFYDLFKPLRSGILIHRFNNAVALDTIILHKLPSRFIWRMFSIFSVYFSVLVKILLHFKCITKAFFFFFFAVRWYTPTRDELISQINNQNVNFLFDIYRSELVFIRSETAQTALCQSDSSQNSWLQSMASSHNMWGSVHRLLSPAPQSIPAGIMMSGLNRQKNGGFCILNPINI